MKAEVTTSTIALGLQNTPEQLEPIRLQVRGSIPDWLTGSLYRTGPGTFSVPLQGGGTYEVKHWFEGIGMNHKFEITEGGEVWYRCRKAGQHLEETISRTGEVPIITFASTDPCENTFRKFATFFKRAIPGLGPVLGQPSSFNVGVTLTPDMAGVIVPSSHSTNKGGVSYLVGGTDAENHVVIDSETLEPLVSSCYGALHPELAGGQVTSAHPCVDTKTGDVFNYVTKFGMICSYTVFRIRGSGDQRGKVDILANIVDAPIAYLHSSALTERYHVLCIWQADFTGFVCFPQSCDRKLTVMLQLWNTDTVASKLS